MTLLGVAEGCGRVCVDPQRLGTSAGRLDAGELSAVDEAPA